VLQSGSTVHKATSDLTVKEPACSLADQYGWPDRSHLPYEAMEVEAELVSWHIRERRGLITGSAIDLRPCLIAAFDKGTSVDLNRVTMVIAKNEHHIPRS